MAKMDLLSICISCSIKETCIEIVAFNSYCVVCNAVFLQVDAGWNQNINLCFYQLVFCCGANLVVFVQIVIQRKKS